MEKQYTLYDFISLLAKTTITYSIGLETLLRSKVQITHQSNYVSASLASIMLKVGVLNSV